MIFSYSLLVLFALLWLIIIAKKTLFWAYLWQLKEYYPARLIDHFRTYKGRSIFINLLFGLKALILFVLLIATAKTGFLIYLIYFLLTLYALEAVKAVLRLCNHTLKYPVLTSKTLALIGLSFLFFAGCLAELFISVSPLTFILSLLYLDLFSFFFISLFVYLLQIPSLYFKHRLLAKAKKKREQFKNLVVVGITGSYGKTTTKEILSFILEKKYKVLATKKHGNTTSSIANTILNNLKDQQVLIVEIGAYKKGEVKEMCEVVQPQIGVLTGINQQHMAIFGSQKNIIDGKFELIESLPEQGMAVLNWDNELINSNLRSQNPKPCLPDRQAHLKTQNLKFYSVKRKADIWAENIRVEKDKLSFEIFSKEGDSANFEVNLIGSHNVLNILAATTVAYYKFGFSLQEIANICETIPSTIGAMQIKKGINGLNIIDASYSANPDGVFSALDYLKTWQGKKVIIMPCLIELGKSSKQVHEKIGRKIGRVCDLAIIITKDKFREIKKGAIESGMKKENILFIDEPKKIVKKIDEFCSPGDTILLEGRAPKRLVEQLIISNQ